MKTFAGIPVSPGIAIGKAFVYPGGDAVEIPRYSIKKDELSAEEGRLEKALFEAKEEVKSLQERAAAEMSREQAAIFEAHLMMLDDTEFTDQIKDRQKQCLQNIEWVVWEMCREIALKLAASTDPVFRERAVDIADVSHRVINHLLSFTRSRFSLEDLTEDVILVARNLMPSDTVMMNKSRVKGFAMDEGSETCHTAILARAFNIPAVLGLSTLSREVKDGEILVVNGGAGTVITAPDKRTLTRLGKEERQERERNEKFLDLRELPAETKDGYRTVLKANIEFPEEVEQALQFGAEGIGLYRSEFLFITPSGTTGEESQYDAYRRVFKAMGRLPVTIRTIDVGGDKVLPELRVENEKNPLLGWRAIRMSLANPELFKIQLRAILRAGVKGTPRIMFPMISGIEELEQALALLDEARSECVKKGQPVAKKIETGAMIEIPSAAMTADILAEKADFFSIGTNDLLQYSLAVDRGNEKVSYLSDFRHPAILRFLKQVIDAAHVKGIKAAICGELAGDPSATAILLGMGLDEFSMSASSIPRIKQIIRGLDFTACKTLADQVLAGRSIAEVRSAIEAWTADNPPVGKHGKRR